MSWSLSLSRFCDHRHDLDRWRRWTGAIIAAVGCLSFLNFSLAQDPKPAPKRPAAKNQAASESQPSQVRDGEKLLTEQQRLAAEETRLSAAGKYAEAIKVSRQRESVVLELTKLPDRNAATKQMRLDLLQSRINWQWLSGQFADAAMTGEQRLPLVEAEFGAQHWQSANARSALDYSRKLAAADATTRRRMLELDLQMNSAIGKGDFREAIAKADVLKGIETKVLGVEHPFYAHSLDRIASCCLQARDYERAAREWNAALVIRRKAYGDTHPDVLACYDGLAAVARQQRNWDAAHTLYDQAADQRRQLSGTISPEDPAVWLDDFAMDSREKYTVIGNVQWAAGRLTLGSGATIGRTIMAGSAWEARLDLAFPPPETDAKPAMSRFEFTLGKDKSPFAVVWQIDFQDGKAHVRLQLVDIAPKPPGLAGLFAAEQVTVLREADWPHDPSGIWSLRWNSGLLQVYQGQQPVFVSYVKTDADCSAWALRTSVANLGVARLTVQGAARQVNSAAATAQLTQAGFDTSLAKNSNQEGKFADAVKLTERALETRRGILGEDHPRIAQSLNNLAGLHQSQGDYAAAETLQLRALQIFEKSLGPDHPETAISIGNLAGYYQAQGNYAPAESLYLRALKIWEKVLVPDSLNTAISVGNLASLYQIQGNYASAEPLSLRALKIWERLLGPDHRQTATALNNLAVLYVSRQNYTAAEPLHLRALKIRELSLGPDHPDTASSLHNLGLLYGAQGNYTAAESHGQRALKTREAVLGLDHPETASTVQSLAVFQWEQNQAKEAAPLAERALQIRLRHLDATAAIQSEQQQFLMSRQADGDVSIWLTVSGTDAMSASSVYRDVLAWKGLITARQQGLRLALKDDPLFTEFRRVTQQWSTVALSPPLPPSDPKTLDVWKAREPELRRAWESQKAALEVEHERLEKELAVKSVAFREGLEQRRVQPEDLVATLAAQDRPTALVDVLEYRYHPRKNKDEQGEQRIVAFVVRADRPIVRVELGLATTIAEQVGRWRKSFGRKSADHDPGAELRARVWLPLEQHLQGVETVLISPDGPLAQLPWGALPGRKPGTYLLEERALAVIPVPQMLPSLLGKDRRAGPPGSLLLAGDIDYGGDPGRPQDLLAKRDAVGRHSDGRAMQFSNLAAAKNELNSIKHWYVNAEGSGKVTSLQKLEATEAAFGQQVSQHQWLHVITHGFFAPAALTSGQSIPTLAGIGAGLQLEAGRCLVTSVVAAGAAQQDGRLQIGDEILSVANPGGDPVTTAGRAIEEIVTMIRGPVGTQARLQVRQKSDAKHTVEFVLTRTGFSDPLAKGKSILVHPGLLSGLAFAGVNTPPEKDKDDGILTALEVAALDLNQVDAVVLSACETGLGSVAGGEGLLGLQRAFQVAGARTVVASLWKVPDAATARLMQRFYENLWEKKLPKLQALREAQLWMLKEGGRATDKTGARGITLDELQPAVGDGLPPYYWAAFVLSGDWR